MATNIQINNSLEVVELAPNYKIPLVLIAIAIPLCFFSIWAGGIVALFGLFLTIQTVLIRLQFTTQALVVLRSGKILKTFPYSEWLNWKIFWSPIPILFYFREVNSIHFLPIIFDPKTLLDCLNKYYPQQ
ncbi:DUF3119 family protein [Waterburya agarophytonicola K14]|uniref:DUF3119 family protein n=1 Tax=Waterburya agarophytonicola KI4 TaxID=2874699 RepID=A0A964BZM4_9CYAN|nr:DUF3119 family protein [Waterburya agarophytonicola]MCC0179747.1 DUF3119 family protein [Waterburya agarophytonicola KI4]